MHEYSIVQALLGRVRESIEGHDVAAIHSLRVRIGALSGVDGELLKTAYELCVPGTFCEGAALEIEQVPARWHCPRCGQDAAEGQRLSCEICGIPLMLVEGDEIVLERIDLEVRDV